MVFLSHDVRLTHALGVIIHHIPRGAMSRKSEAIWTNLLELDTASRPPPDPRFSIQKAFLVVAPRLSPSIAACLSLPRVFSRHGACCPPASASRYVSGSVSGLPLESGTFAGVILGGGFDTEMESPAGTMRSICSEAMRVLRPGGLFLVVSTSAPPLLSSRLLDMCASGDACARAYVAGVGETVGDGGQVYAYSIVKDAGTREPGMSSEACPVDDRAVSMPSSRDAPTRALPPEQEKTEPTPCTLDCNPGDGGGHRSPEETALEGDGNAPADAGRRPERTRRELHSQGVEASRAAGEAKEREEVAQGSARLPWGTADLLCSVDDMYVNVELKMDTQLKKSDFSVDIGARRVRVRHGPPHGRQTVLDWDLEHKIDVDESTWSIVDRTSLSLR